MAPKAVRYEIGLPPYLPRPSSGLLSGVLRVLLRIWRRFLNFFERQDCWLILLFCR